MGLDWRPMGKPKPGFEERYNYIFRFIQGKEKQEPGFFDKLKGKKAETKEQLLEEWFANCIPSYETIKAPRVGKDAAANEWLKERYEESDKSHSLEQFMIEYDGYYVIELAPELDGVPVYTTFDQDKNVFRAQFLKDCEDIIGEDLLAEAWGTKLADETLQYGQQLMEIADKTATENNLLHLKTQRLPPDADENTLESRIHILYAAAKWLIFYGKNGHGYEADF